MAENLNFFLRFRQFAQRGVAFVCKCSSHLHCPIVIGAHGVAFGAVVLVTGSTQVVATGTGPMVATASLMLAENAGLAFVLSTVATASLMDTAAVNAAKNGGRNIKAFLNHNMDVVLGSTRAGRFEDMRKLTDRVREMFSRQ